MSTDSGAADAFVIDEHILDDGSYCRTRLEATGERLRVLEGRELRGTVPVRALVAIVERYAMPLDPGVELDGPSLRLPGGGRLARLQFRARVDASARDYLVLTRPDREPVAVLSTAVAGALRFLFRGE